MVLYIIKMELCLVMGVVLDSIGPVIIMLGGKYEELLFHLWPWARISTRLRKE
jgi:hypothetical protein